MLLSKQAVQQTGEGASVPLAVVVVLLFVAVVALRCFVVLNAVVSVLSFHRLTLYCACLASVSPASSVGGGAGKGMLILTVR